MSIKLLLAQSVIPGGADPRSSIAFGASGAIDNIVGIFTKKPNVDPTSIPGALDELWKVSMGGTLYQITCALGLTIAVIAVGFWSTKLYQTLRSGEMHLVVNDLVWPIVLLILLSNGGKNMSDATVVCAI